jgi:hypothetical protein
MTARVPGYGTMVAIDRTRVATYPAGVARRRGSLLLIAFLGAVMAAGSGGVTAPWVPKPIKGEPSTASVTHVIQLSDAATWRLHRME